MRNESSFFKKNSVRAILAALLLFLFINFLPAGVTRTFKNILSPVAAPLQGMTGWIAFELSEMMGFFSAIGNLKKENERLEQERFTLLHDHVRLLELEEENRLLRESLQLPIDTGFETLSAEVIGRDMNGVSMSLTINRGSTDEIKVGMPVVIGKGTIIGIISIVHLTSSEVRLLSHADSTLAARIAGSSVQGVIRGDHGLGLVFDLALAEEALAPGALLVTSGLGDNLPKGLSIGEIREIKQSSDRLFQQATVSVPMDFNDVRFVSILK